MGCHCFFSSVVALFQNALIRRLLMEFHVILWSLRPMAVGTVLEVRAAVRVVEVGWRSAPLFSFGGL